MGINTCIGYISTIVLSMRILVVLSLCVVAVSALETQFLHVNWQLDDFWTGFQAVHKKVYISATEAKRRFKVFEANVNDLIEHNKLYASGKKTWYKAINEFTDMHPAEFVARFNGFDGAAAKNKTRFVPTEAPLKGLADTVDWRTKGAVTPVKNQQQCGSCWAFSTTGSLEGQNFLKTGKLVSLSEQQLVDCSKQNNGCGGGMMDYAFAYIKKNGGIDTEASYPYEAVASQCRFKPSNVAAKDVGFVDVESTETALKQAVATKGPVSVAIDASDLQSYGGGVYDDPDCGNNPQSLDHGVLVVGYGTDKATEMDYWLVKNSWGESWGEAGYVRMHRNAKNQCGVADMPSYPLV